MRILASYILKGPLQASLSAAIPAVLSINAPFLLKLILIYFSAIVVALVSLHLGAKKGLSILLTAVIAALVVAEVLQINDLARLDLWNAIYLWALAWLAACVLYSTRSLALALEIIGLVSVIPIMFFFAMVDEPIEFGLRLMEPMRPLLSGPDSAMTPQQVNDALRWAATRLAGSVVAFTALGVIISLFIARSWQARMFKPGGWQQEFRNLRLSRNEGLVAIVAILALIFSSQLGQPLGLVLVNINVIIVLVYVIFGLAVVHGVIASSQSSSIWLAGVYVLLVLLNKVVAPLLIVLAISDIWVNYRARFENKMG